MRGRSRRPALPGIPRRRPAVINDPYGIELLDRWLDQNVAEPYREQPLAQDWSRVAKVIEELGESIAALIGYTGQNPRKGVTDTEEHMLDEIADTLIACVLAIQHFTKDTARTTAIVDNRWQYRLTKAKLPPT